VPNIKHYVVWGNASQAQKFSLTANKFSQEHVIYLLNTKHFDSQLEGCEVPLHTERFCEQNCVVFTLWMHGNRH